MKLDLTDTVLSSFDRIASKATAGLIGFGIALGVIVTAGISAGTFVSGLGEAGIGTSMGSSLSMLIYAITAVIYLVTVAMLTVGSFRAFDQQDVKKEMFTENILWPFLRMTGCNIVIQSFVLTALYLMIYPLLLIGGASSYLLMGAVGAGTGMSPMLIAGAATAILIFVGTLLYIMAALTLSLPRISINDRRMFKALDESVQATSGNRLRIIAAFLPAAIFIGTGMASMMLIGGLAGIGAYIVLAAIGSFYALGLLTELNNRL